MVISAARTCRGRNEKEPQLSLGSLVSGESWSDGEDCGCVVVYPSSVRLSDSGSFAI